ncbi:tetratricopeptide repeat protein [Candidatus Uabimicrobium sp. HlEnr_7]|uniref:protein kinase domain-containing protein n=1 Tax=Candidatus Uabimicrobium helgolandensis TaxID=3095367 RepID=UPI003557CDF0
MQKKYRVFGKYQIISELGRGGMGVVYKAYDTILKSNVALKMILNKEREHIGRFFTETTAIAKLNHPNIVRFYEYGENPYPYFTMEYIEGYTLADLIKHKKITPEQLIDILIPICDALHYSHRNEIMHRDIKPSNIIITKDGVPKIMDFGLAKREDKTQLSKSGQILGTVAYMSPEQVRGNATYKSDMYSLGASMYEALTFRTVFQGATDINVIMQIMDDAPLNLRQLNPDISPYLEAICLKCLQKKQQKRYQNFKQLSKEFINYKEHRPIIARQYSLRDVLTNFIAKHKVICFSLLFIFIGLTISLFITLKALAFTEQEKRKTKATLNKTMEVIEYSLKKYQVLQKDKQFARLCDNIFEDLEAYGENKDWSFIKSYIASKSGDIRNSLRYSSEQIQLNPTNALAYFNRGGLYTRIKEYEKALADYNKALELTSGYRDVHFNRAILYTKMRKYNKALVDYSKAIELDPKFTQSYMNRGSLYQQIKEYGKALIDYNKVIELNPKFHKINYSRGTLYTEIKQYRKALADYSKAIEFNPQSIGTYMNRGSLYTEIKQYRKALADYDKVIELDPKLAMVYMNRGLLYIERKQYDKALVDCSKAIDLDSKLLNAYVSRGLVYQETNEYEKALIDYSKAIALNLSDNSLTHLYRGYVYINLKPYNKAINDFKKVTITYPQAAHKGLYHAYKNLGNGNKAKYHLLRIKNK